MTKEARIHNEVKSVSSINAVGKTGKIHANNKTRPLYYTIKKINSTWIKNLN